MRGLVIAGTDTGVGKTLIAAGLLRRLRAEGIDAAPMKPVQTGAAARGGVLVAPDLDFCLAAAGLAPSHNEYADMCPYRFEPACSPHLAARLAGDTVDIERIAAAAARLAARRAALLVELAGGLAVPLNDRDTNLDLVRALALPVVLVARGALGTLNHTLLSLAALRAAGVAVAGVIVNDAQPCTCDAVREDNPCAIGRFGKTRILADISHLPSAAAATPDWRAFDARFGDIAAFKELLWA